MPDHLRDATEMVPTPPSRAALAAVLVQAAEPDCALLADRPVSDVGGAQRIDLANGWRLSLWWHPGPELARLWAATAPDGGIWSFGCDRWPDWNAGPEAVVLEPLRHLLTDEQRERLRQRLLTCSCWPEPDPLPEPEPPTMAELFPEAWAS
jgi:hypothetical protein